MVELEEELRLAVRAGEWYGDAALRVPHVVVEDIRLDRHFPAWQLAFEEYFIVPQMLRGETVQSPRIEVECRTAGIVSLLDQHARLELRCQRISRCHLRQPCREALVEFDRRRNCACQAALPALAVFLIA